VAIRSSRTWAYAAAGRVRRKDPLSFLPCAPPSRVPAGASCFSIDCLLPLTSCCLSVNEGVRQIGVIGHRRQLTRPAASERRELPVGHVTKVTIRSSLSRYVAIRASDRTLSRVDECSTTGFRLRRGASRDPGASRSGASGDATRSAPSWAAGLAPTTFGLAATVSWHVLEISERLGCTVGPAVATPV
jgi:hypothetical protein